MVVGIRYRDGKSAAKAHAILRTLDSNSVVAIFVHVAGLSARPQTHKYRLCPLRSNNDHFTLAQQRREGPKHEVTALQPAAREQSMQA